MVLDEPATLAVVQVVRVVVEPPAAEAAPQAEPPWRPSRFGFAKGMFEMREDFNDPLEEFAEYI